MSETTLGSYISFFSKYHRIRIPFQEPKLLMKIFLQLKIRASPGVVECLSFLKTPGLVISFRETNPSMTQI